MHRQHEIYMKCDPGKSNPILGENKAAFRREGHNIHEIYMANARRLNATYIPLTRVGGFALSDPKNLRHPTQKIQTCWYLLR